MPRNGTNRPNASHVVWCLEDPQFQADKPEVQFEKKIVLPLLKPECVSFLLLIRDASLEAFIDKFLLQKFRPWLKERLPSLSIYKAITYHFLKVFLSSEQKGLSVVVVVAAGEKKVNFYCVHYSDFIILFTLILVFVILVFSYSFHKRS